MWLRVRWGRAGLVCLDGFRNVLAADGRVTQVSGSAHVLDVSVHCVLSESATNVCESVVRG